jgi:Na+-driven multidrug efflux pump
VDLEKLLEKRIGSKCVAINDADAAGFAEMNFGAGKKERITRGFRIASAVMAAWGTLIMATLYFGGYALFGLFLSENNLKLMGAVYLRILAPCQIFACLEGVGSGAFRGGGKTMQPSTVSVICNAIRVPLCYWLSTTSLGLVGVWYGVASTALLRGLLIYAWSFVAVYRQNTGGQPTS